MMWYKAWRESRFPFLMIAAVVGVICVYAVLAPVREFEGHHLDFESSVYRTVYYGQAKGLFCMLLPFIGMGGLLRDRARHMELFTLALPVTRVELTGSFIAVGFVQLVVLSLIPVALVPILSGLAGQFYSLLETLRFAILWIGYGSPIFAMAIVLSVTLGGEFVAPAVAFVLILLYEFINILARDLGLPFASIITSMNGIGTVHGSLVGAIPTTGLPWWSLLASSAIAGALVALAIQLARRQEF